MRRTGPSAATVEAVRFRDGWCCVGCGATYSLTTQHRVSRGMGGTRREWVNRPANLLTLCGSGTTGCHGWTEAHPLGALALGWALPRVTADPAVMPVRYPEGWFLLDDDGRRTRTEDPRGHDRGESRGWGAARLDQEVGPSWPSAEARSGGPEDALRPWGSAGTGRPDGATPVGG